MSIRKEFVNAVVSDLVVGIRESLDQYTRTCLNCSFFDEASETCRMYNQRPPARIIVWGCESHEDINDIPF